MTATFHISINNNWSGFRTRDINHKSTTGTIMVASHSPCIGTHLSSTSACVSTSAHELILWPTLPYFCVWSIEIKEWVWALQGPQQWIRKKKKEKWLRSSRRQQQQYWTTGTQGKNDWKSTYEHLKYWLFFFSIKTYFPQYM